MTEVAEGVYFIKGQDDMIPDSHVYIIGRPGSGDLSMIDAGLVGKGRYKLDAVAALGIDLNEIKRIIMTHTHLDHISCLPEIRAEIPDVELWGHSVEAESLEKGDERAVYGMDMFRNMCQAQYGLKDGIFKLNVDRKLNDNDILEVGDMKWEVLHIPGHSAGAVALYERQQKVLIPGDVVYADYAIGRFDLHGADPLKHRESLYRLAELEVDILLPGHNRIMVEVPEGYIRDTADQWSSYLR
ncbi:MAG: MBL fold metallo-hydrolase [Desulfobacteraceae bacterium]|jgi:glyoxylase-like metal-dependent hydrolase (beta-lactamase superfamily II)